MLFDILHMIFFGLMNLFAGLLIGIIFANGGKNE